MATFTKKSKPITKKSKTKKPKTKKIASVYDEWIATGGSHHDAEMVAAIHANGLGGNVQAQKFWLANRAPEQFSEHLKVTAQRGPDLGAIAVESREQVIASIMNLVTCKGDDEVLEGESSRITPESVTPPPDTRDRTQGRGISTGATTTATKPEQTSDEIRQTTQAMRSTKFTI